MGGCEAPCHAAGCSSRLGCRRQALAMVDDGRRGPAARSRSVLLRSFVGTDIEMNMANVTRDSAVMANSGKPLWLGGSSGHSLIPSDGRLENKSPAAESVARTGAIDGDAMDDASNPFMGSNDRHHPVCEDPGLCLVSCGSVSRTPTAGGRGHRRRAIAPSEISILSKCAARYRRQIA